MILFAICSKWIPPYSSTGNENTSFYKLIFNIYLVLRPSLVLENVLNYVNNTKIYSWHHACSLQPENKLSVFVYLTHILHSCFLLMCMLCCFVLMVVKLACRLCWVQRVPLWRVHQLLSSPRQVSPYSLSYWKFLSLVTFLVEDAWVGDFYDFISLVARFYAKSFN
jgi:hypothetical protein